MNDVFLVTGGEGFIGRNIISKLKDLGGEPYSLDKVGKPDFKVSITNRKKLDPWPLPWVFFRLALVSSHQSTSYNMHRSDPVQSFSFQETFSPRTYRRNM